MGKYFQLQCKRLLRFLPGALFVALILMVCLLVVFGAFSQQNASQEDKQPILVALCGETDDPFIQMGLTAVSSMDASRFAMELVEMEDDQAARALAMGEIAAYVIIPEGFMEAAFYGEILPIKFYTTVGASGIVTMAKEELSTMISSLLLTSQKGVYGMWDAMIENDLRAKTEGQMDALVLEYVDYIFTRDRMLRVEELGIADSLGFENYLLCGLGVLLLLLICLSFAPQMIPGDPALGRMLCSKQKPAWLQSVCDFVAYAAALLCLLLVLIVLAALFVPNLGNPLTLLLAAIPVVLLVAAFSFMLYSLSRDIIGGVLLQFFVSIILCFVSGCLYPVYFFPVQVQKLAQWLPTGTARTQLASFITGSAPNWNLPVLLGYCLVFAAIGMFARVRHIREVRG